MRINLEVMDKDEVRNRRIEEVKKLKKGFKELENCFSIHEGYREIFI